MGNLDRVRQAVNCEGCEGKGHTVGINPHTGDWGEDRCAECHGTGRERDQFDAKAFAAFVDRVENIEAELKELKARTKEIGMTQYGRRL